MDLRFRVVIRYIGFVQLVLAVFMLLSAGIAYVNDVDTSYSPLLMSSLLTLLMCAEYGSYITERGIVYCCRCLGGVKYRGNVPISDVGRRIYGYKCLV